MDLYWLDIVQHEYFVLGLLTFLLVDNVYLLSLCLNKRFVAEFHNGVAHNIKMFQAEI